MYGELKGSVTRFLERQAEDGKSSDDILCFARECNKEKEFIAELEKQLGDSAQGAKEIEQGRSNGHKRCSEHPVDAQKQVPRERVTVRMPKTSSQQEPQSRESSPESCVISHLQVFSVQRA